MKTTDLTKAIKALREKQLAQEIWDEVNSEIERDGLDSLMQEVEHLLAKADSTKNNIVNFPSRFTDFASTTLMAAAGTSLGNWFDHPIVFPSVGFMVDIRKVQGTESEADIYIQPISQDTETIEKVLTPFKRKNLNIQFTINGKLVLEAEVYVDESGHEAEGSGHLFDINTADAQGKLSIDIKVDE